jgi:hypothetical protein
LHAYSLDRASVGSSLIIDAYDGKTYSYIYGKHKQITIMSIFEEELIFNAAVIAAIIGVIGSLMVAVLKTFFDWKNEKMRAKLNLDAQEQAHAQGLIAQEQAYNQRISEKMIDRVHEYAANYYYPLLKRSDDFNYYLEKMGKKTDEEIKKVSFFRFVLYIKAQNKLDNKVGAILLNSFDVETKITDLIYFFEKKINLNLRDISFLINKVEAVDYASFETTLELSDLIKSLTAFFEIFVYGINMVFYPWYGEKPKPPVEGYEIYQELKLPLDS